jgi:Rrf2 family nitric oxide-sensitive transcriptional repressor
MRLALHTDFSLRVLMYLGSLERSSLATTPMLADRFRVSLHHLQKVVQTLRKLELVETTQGMGGGIRLASDPSDLRLGQIVSSLESSGRLAECEVGPCPLMGACFLKIALDDAEQAFFDHLDQYSLADVINAPARKVLRFMQRVE